MAKVLKNVYFNSDNADEAELLAFLYNQKNVSEYIKNLIRQDMKPVAASVLPMEYLDKLQQLLDSQVKPEPVDVQEPDSIIAGILNLGQNAL